MSKCECKNCVHEEVCRIREFPSIDEILKDGCPHYKGKSLIVELPCKVGDEVWEICYGIHYNMMSSVPYIATSRVISLHIEEEVLIETENANYYIEHIGKRLFFTREDAERKLKEVGEMNKCINCKYADLTSKDYPCYVCEGNDRFESVETKRTNFDKITESVEILAEHLVESISMDLGGLRHRAGDGKLCATWEEAKQRTIEWLQKECDNG